MPRREIGTEQDRLRRRREELRREFGSHKVSSMWKEYYDREEYSYYAIVRDCVDRSDRLLNAIGRGEILSDTEQRFVKMVSTWEG